MLPLMASWPVMVATQRKVLVPASKADCDGGTTSMDHLPGAYRSAAP